MAYYIFADCQVHVDENAYRPILRELDVSPKVSVLLISDRVKEAQLPMEEKTDVPAREQ